MQFEEILKCLRENDPALTELESFINDLDEVTALSEALKNNRTLTRLDLSRNVLTIEKGTPLVEMLKINQTLLQLDLSNCKISATLASDLAAALEFNKTLTHFKLANNKMFVAGICALIDMLKINRTLTYIDLSGNRIYDEQFLALVDVLKNNKTLTQIDLNSCRISDTGVINLVKLLKNNKTLVRIELQNNNISDIGGDALIEALKINQTLTHLDLSSSYHGSGFGHSPEISENVLQKIKGYIERNKQRAVLLIQAAQTGNLAKVKELLTQGVSVNYQDQTGNTALHFAAQRNYHDIATLLLVQPEQVRLRNNNGELPQVKGVISGFSKSTSGAQSTGFSGAASSSATPVKQAATSPTQQPKLSFSGFGKPTSVAQPTGLFGATPSSADPIKQAATPPTQQPKLSFSGFGKTTSAAQPTGLFGTTPSSADPVKQAATPPAQQPKFSFNGFSKPTSAAPTGLFGAASSSAIPVKQAATPPAEQPKFSFGGFNKPTSAAQPSLNDFGAASFSATTDKQAATPLVSKLADLQKIPWSALQFNKTTDLLAQGAYGDVYQGKWNGIDVAIKVLHLKKMPNELLKDFEGEANIMAQCLFPSIVRLYGVCIEPAHYTLVMEYLAKGSLYEVLQDKQTELTWAARWEIALDIAKGLAYLHDKNILHRDLKSMNVLVGTDGHAKITDFGLSRIKIETSSSSTLANKTTGSIRWRAPELFKYKATYTSACDIYSFGMLLWEIAARTLPFAEELDDQMVISWVKEGVQQDIPADCPPAFAEIIQSCLSVKSEARPTAQLLVGMLEKAKPQLTAIQDLLPLKEPAKSWHFSEHLLEQAQEAEETNGFALLPAGPEDIGKVFQFYSHHPVPGYDLKRVEVIYNRGQNQIFERRMKMLDERAHPACVAAFAPKWSTEFGKQWREQVDNLCRTMAKPYQDPRFPNVQLLPLWHGTGEAVLESLLRTGYANLATTDLGFFGKGIYSTGEAEYAYRVYSQKGPLVLNWVAFYSAYPTIDGDMAKLMEKGSYQNYDAHFVPVVPASNKPNEVNYYSTKPNQQHTYTELVVFDPNQCLPRYLVELQPTLTKMPANLGGNPHTLFYKGKIDQVVYVNLLVAAKYVYENYLSKPYTLKQGDDWQIDWEYRHPSNGKIIHRPNHGLAHTLRKMFYAPLVVEHYITYQQLSDTEAKQLKKDINVIQLALLFFISGRENDLGSVNNEANFQRFRQQSTDNFERYVQDAGIKLRPEKVALFKQALLWFQGTDDQGYLKHIRCILWQCHFIDLLRCLTPKQFAGSISYVDQQIGQARREQLSKLAEISINKTGDRLLGISQQQDYQPDLFVETSSSVEKCMQHLQTAWREFEVSLQAQMVASASAAVEQLTL